MNVNEQIADVLANFHDWPVENLREEFMNYVSNGIDLVTQDEAFYIFEKFMQINAQERYAPKFDHVLFVVRTRRDYCKD